MPRYQVFRAAETFASDETESTYMEGMTYTVRPPEHYPEDQKAARRRAAALVELVPQWAEEGKIEFTATSGSGVAGQGTVE